MLDRDRLEGAIAAYLHGLIGRSAVAAELTVRIRAAQTAAFHLGWLLQVSIDRLIATTSSPSAAAVRTRASWQAFRMFRQPHIGALLVLVALGLDVASLVALPTGAVAVDGRAVTVHGTTLPTPPGAAVLLRAQRVVG